MNLLESLKMAVATLAANKMRSSLTMLGIVIGNASVIGMVGIGQGAQKLAQDQFKSLGPNVLFIVPGSSEGRRTSFDLPKTLVLADAEAIAKQVPTVTEVAPQINSNRLITYRDRNANELIVGITPEFLTVRSFALTTGRFVTDIDLKRNQRVAVLGPEVADKLFPQQDPMGKKIRIKDISFEVIGIMEAKGSFLGTNQDTTVYIPLTTMANQIVGNNSPYGTQVTFIAVTAIDQDSIRAARFQIENLLRLRHKIVGKDDFTVQTQKDILDVIGIVTDGLTVLLAAIAGISLLVGGIGVMNIMLVSVTERTQEIGLRKAVGAKESDILQQFLIEATILSVLGGAIGLFFGVIPARTAAKLDPIVALRTA